MDISEQVQDSVAKAKEQVLEDLDFMNLGNFSQHLEILKIQILLKPGFVRPSYCKIFPK